MAVRLWCVMVLLVLACGPALGQEGFSVRVRANFDRWDKNHDGRLSADELSFWMADPSVQGEDAAAVATLRRFARPAARRPAYECTLATLDVYDRQLASHQRTFLPLNATWKMYVKRIQGAVRMLYAEGAPHRDRIKQVSGGDCYLLSVLGGMITRNPDDVRALLADNGDGSYTVRLPDGAPVIVKAPTDAELAMYADSSTDGLWLYALQRAFIVRALVKNPRGVDKDEPNEMTERGGSPGFVMQLVTGRRSWGFALKDDAVMADRVREALKKSLLGEKRLVTVTTPKANSRMRLPLGIARQHVMSLIAYDAATDTVTLWNPWGNEFTPKGPAPWGGYPTAHGVFHLPLADLVRYFGWITFQS